MMNLTARPSGIDASLWVPPLPLLVPVRVFETVTEDGARSSGFSWCSSDHLHWVAPRPIAMDTPIDGSDPERMVFVLHGPCDFLPTELASVHALGLGFTSEQALAPWGIDAATDGFFAHRVRPGDVLTLAADNLNALFWGLHDWAHFHNHGPFDEPALTEVQCDASALVWLWLNRSVVGLDDDAWERVRRQAQTVARRRLEEERVPFDTTVLEACSLHALGATLESNRPAG